MPSFTEDIKQEISLQKFESREEKLALFSGFLRTSGSVASSGGVFGFEYVTENENIAYLFEEMLTRDFSLNLNLGTKTDTLSGRDKYTFSCFDGSCASFLTELGVLGEDKKGRYLSLTIPEDVILDDNMAVAFIKGAFLGGGSCTIPDASTYSPSGYHLEFIFSQKFTAEDFLSLLSGVEILAKLVARKDVFVVYVKSKEVIADILALLSASSCLERLEEVIRQKEIINNNNRATNCSVSNIDKTITASITQVRSIEILRETIGLKSLDEQLFEVAEARLADKSASMNELAERLGITKSCINHRMRKIIAMAKELEE
ncbi:MAG: DNA-binding protein WhiA [Clostridia bacterium]|nr:DNA-binding protein WhiA [Clostridia bacterium]